MQLDSFLWMTLQKQEQLELITTAILNQSLEREERERETDRQRMRERERDRQRQRDRARRKRPWKEELILPQHLYLCCWSAVVQQWAVLYSFLDLVASPDVGLEALGEWSTSVPTLIQGPDENWQNWTIASAVPHIARPSYPNRRTKQTHLKKDQPATISFTPHKGLLY